MELQKQIEDLHNLQEDINDGLKDRDDELKEAFDKADKFETLLQVC